MRKALAATLLVAGAAIAVPAMSHADVTALPTKDALGHDKYLVTDANAGTVEIWSEDNTLPNLQTEPTPLFNEDGSPKLDENGNQIIIPADSQDL